MARKSNIARDQKRQRMINQYAAKRAELKAMGDYEGLAKLPRKFIADALEESLHRNWSSARLHENVRVEPFIVPRTCK